MEKVTVNSDGTIVVSSPTSDGVLETLTYSPRLVTAPDGSRIEGVSAWATMVGALFVEVSHLGDGPIGGELVMVVTDPATGEQETALGDLVAPEVPAEVNPSWPAAVDLALGLIVETTLDSGTKDEVEEFHQRLLGVMFAQQGFPTGDHHG